MKAKSKIIKMLFCVYLVLIKFIPRVELRFEADFYICFVAFVISACCIGFIPKRIFGVSAAILVTVGTSIYQYQYCIYALPVLFLICAHKEALLENKKISKQKRKGRLSETFSVFSIVSLVLQFIYVLNNRKYFENLDTIGEWGYTAFILVLFVFLFIVSFSEIGTYQSKMKKDVAIKFRLVYLAAIVGICVMVWSLLLTATIKTIKYDVAHIYWFVLFVEIILNEDPFLDKLIKNFERLVTGEKSKKW